MPSTPEPSINSSDKGSDEYGKTMRRKIKLESVLTSGCGVGKSKQKVVDAFWNYVWPELVTLGWTKVDGTGKLAGSTFFVPKGVDLKLGRKGRDYYDRIKAVIDRVLERRNDSESNIADTYQSKVVEEVERDARPKRSAPARSSARIDLSWKEGGKNFPKLTSRVGFEYQATEIPMAGTYTEAKQDDDLYYDQIWDPVRAVAHGNLDFIHKVVPPSKREMAIILLNSRNYNCEGIVESLNNMGEVECSDWSQEEKEKFIQEIFRLRKDFTALSQALGKSMKSCWAYYLRFFKQSDRYRLLKAIITEERGDKSASGEHSLDACAICGNGGSLLICDGCEGEYHISCLRPPLRSVPEGTWECDECVDRNFLDARDSLIQNTTLFERAKKKQKVSGKESDGSPGSSKEQNEIVLRPASPVLLSIRTFARKISETLSSPPVKSTSG